MCYPIRGALQGVPVTVNFPHMRFDLRKIPNYVFTFASAMTQPGERTSMRKVLFAVAIILGVGVFVGSTIVPSPAQPIDCSKKKC
jgi:hypothetical protein